MATMASQTCSPALNFRPLYKSKRAFSLEEKGTLTVRHRMENDRPYAFAFTESGQHNLQTMNGELSEIRRRAAAEWNDRRSGSLSPTSADARRRNITTPNANDHRFSWSNNSMCYASIAVCVAVFWMSSYAYNWARLLLHGDSLGYLLSQRLTRSDINESCETAKGPLPSKGYMIKGWSKLSHRETGGLWYSVLATENSILETTVTCGSFCPALPIVEVSQGRCSQQKHAPQLKRHESSCDSRLGLSHETSGVCLYQSWKMKMGVVYYINVNVWWMPEFSLRLMDTALASNDACPGAIPLVINQTVLVSTENSSGDDNDTPCSAPSESLGWQSGAWYSVKGNGKPLRAIHDGYSATLLSGLNCENTKCIAPGFAGASGFAWMSEKDEQFYILVQDGHPRSFNLTVEEFSDGPENRFCKGAVSVQVGSEIKSTLAGACLTNLPVNSCTCGIPRHSIGIWYSVIATSTSMTASVYGMPDTQVRPMSFMAYAFSKDVTIRLSIFYGDCTSTLDELVCSSNLLDGDQTTTWQAVIGRRYFLLVHCTQTDRHNWASYYDGAKHRYPIRLNVHNKTS